MTQALNCKVYGHVPMIIEQGTIDLDVDDIRVALFDENHSFNVADTEWADIKANEITGTNYTSGGKSLSHSAVDPYDPVYKLEYDSVTGTYSFGKMADDTEWDNSTITADYAAVYVYTDNAGVPADSSLLLCCLEFDGQAITVADLMKIEWHANGIFRFRVNP